MVDYLETLAVREIYFQTIQLLRQKNDFEANSMDWKEKDCIRLLVSKRLRMIGTKNSLIFGKRFVEVRHHFEAETL